MDDMMAQLYQRQISGQQIVDCFASIPMDVGMQASLQLIRERNAHQLILSDSNTVFIDSVLRARNLRDFFPDEWIFTNPAVFEGERLHVETFQPADQPHQCPLCPLNLCKGQVLSKILSEADQKEENVRKFARVVYLGDGAGDFCPASRLRSCDLVLAREGYALAKKIEQHPIQATVQLWKNGDDVLEYLTRFLN
eukprot:TRINITY_DN8609_c0_g1_i5.p1 TRINITY_DN8609_c0_g1~~TRINITY_DN8609_c0_g1_i5.p1  ORF type:complete len:195 (+),score=33.31 TRINITY_DN8609_c0_g1_i5:210-794(+)